MRRNLGLLAVVLLTGCGVTTNADHVPPARAAEPQKAELGWRERYPPTGSGLLFDVDRLQVRRDGWSVDIAVTNSTGIPFELGKPDELQFGLMLFDTNDHDALTEAAKTGSLPPLRQAKTIEPSPPRVLQPGATWRATLSAPGALAAGSWIRVSFGPFDAVGTPPEGMEPRVGWITDKAHQL